MHEYPAPVAISIALSSDSSDTLASLCLGGKFMTTATVTSFFSRLVLEKPLFEPTAVLGTAIIHIFAKYGDGQKELLTKVLALKGMKESVQMGFRHFLVRRTGIDLFLMFTGSATTLAGDRVPQLTSATNASLEALLEASRSEAEEFKFE